MSKHKKTNALESHLQSFHQQGTRFHNVREVVLGAIDGIVTTLAVVSGFAGAQQGGLGLSAIVVLLFGFANLAADGLSMGLSNFLGIRADKQQFRSQAQLELMDVRNRRAETVKLTYELLERDGYREAEARKLVPVISSNERFWHEFLMHHELGMSEVSTRDAGGKGLFTFLAFVLFGLLPLFPYILPFPESVRFLLAILASFIALLMLSIFRWKATSERFLMAVFETILVGGVACAAAFGVGLLFR